MLSTKLKLLPLLFLVINSFAQNAPVDSVKTAPVSVFVTDMKGKPSKGEQVLFKNELTQKIFGGRSDASGRFSLKLPAGSDYIITVKSITDTAKYGTINIPALKEDEYYTEPFKVNVRFEAARSYTLDNVHFDFGKASLRPDSFKELEELVSYLKNKENIKIEIAGHTDNVGKGADNLKLSQQRADAIKSYIIKKGISSTRVIAKGYGDTEPIADNDNDEGRQLNRRTEVRIL